MWTLIKEETRRWATSARNVPKSTYRFNSSLVLSRYKYPSELGPPSYTPDLQHRL